MDVETFTAFFVVGSGGCRWFTTLKAARRYMMATINVALRANNLPLVSKDYSTYRHVFPWGDTVSLGWVQVPATYDISKLRYCCNGLSAMTLDKLRSQYVAVKNGKGKG